MHRKIIPSPLVLLLATLSLLASACSEQGRQSAQVSWQPPGFEAVTATGDKFSYPADLQGPTIVLFWATWCPYCKALMPHLQSIVDEHEGRVSVLALHFKDENDPAKFLAQHGYSFKLIPQSENVAKRWGVKGTPGLFLADQSGTVIFSKDLIPLDAYPRNPSENYDELKNSQKAARRAPFWAAELRKSIDLLID